MDGSCEHPAWCAQLNKAAWRPAREGRSVRLQRGALQLPAHTQLLLDETQLAAGTLTGTGVDNLKVLCTRPKPCLKVSLAACGLFDMQYDVLGPCC